MPTSKIANFIDTYTIANEMKLYNADSIELEVLGILSDFSRVVEFLHRNHDEINSLTIDNILEKYGYD